MLTEVCEVQHSTTEQEVWLSFDYIPYRSPLWNLAHMTDPYVRLLQTHVHLVWTDTIDWRDVTFTCFKHSDEACQEASPVVMRRHIPMYLTLGFFGYMLECTDMSTVYSTQWSYRYVALRSQFVPKVEHANGHDCPLCVHFAYEQWPKEGRQPSWCVLTYVLWLMLSLVFVIPTWTRRWRPVWCPSRPGRRNHGNLKMWHRPVGGVAPVGRQHCTACFRK